MNLCAIYVQRNLDRDWSRYHALGLRDVFLASWERGFEEAIVKAEASGLRVHGWISPAHIIKENPDLCINISGYLWPDWRLQEVQDMSVDVVADMVYRYDVQPHLDYMRGRWEKSSDSDVPDWFNAEPITETVAAIRRATEGFYLSTSGISYIDGQKGNGQGWPGWGADELVDAVCPMLYQGERWSYYFDHWRKVCSDAAWLQPALSFNVDGDGEPFSVAAFEYRLAETLAVYSGCAFFDADLLDAHPQRGEVEAVIKRYVKGDSMSLMNRIDVVDAAIVEIDNKLSLLIAEMEGLRQAAVEADDVIDAARDTLSQLADEIDDD